MSVPIHHYLDQLLGSIGGVRPPIDPGVLQSLYERKDYASMLGWIKKSMNLDLRVGLRVVESPGRTAPLWIEVPQRMPPYGTAEFQRTRVVVNVRRDLLETKPFTWVVAGFAHELAHVVLFSIGHPLQHNEKAVDLTAMVLGYQRFIADAEITQTRGLWLSAILALLLLPLGILFFGGGSRQTQRLGYLTAAEAKTAQQRLISLAKNGPVYSGAGW